jgi:hypothetical protein
VEEQIEVGEIMKNIKKSIILATIMLLFGAGTIQLVCAKALGEGWTLGEYPLGWILIIVAIIGGFIVLLAKASKVLKWKGAGALTVPVVIILLLGVAMVFVEVEPVTAVSKCPEFEITASAVTTGTYYISTVNWDEDENLFTIPLTVSDSSDGNLTDHITALNFTIDPIAGGRTADTMATIHMDSDYTIQYGGEDIFDKTGDYYDVNWTSPTGTESYKDTQDMQVSETSWALCTWEFNNGTAGNWVTELSAIGNSITWHVNFWNDDNTWTETIMITATVVSYTA